MIINSLKLAIAFIMTIATILFFYVVFHFTSNNLCLRKFDHEEFIISNEEERFCYIYDIQHNILKKGMHQTEIIAKLGQPHSILKGEQGLDGWFIFYRFDKKDFEFDHVLNIHLNDNLLLESISLKGVED